MRSRYDGKLQHLAAMAEVSEKALTGPSVRDGPLQDEMLSQMRHDLEMALSVAMSRPQVVDMPSHAVTCRDMQSHAVTCGHHMPSHAVTCGHHMPSHAVTCPPHARHMPLHKPQEWFTIIGRSLNHGEGELIERARLIRVAEDTHATELATSAMRSAEELEAQQQSARRASQTRAAEHGR